MAKKLTHFIGVCNICHKQLDDITGEYEEGEFPSFIPSGMTIPKSSRIMTGVEFLYDNTPKIVSCPHSSVKWVKVDDV